MERVAFSSAPGRTVGAREHDATIRSVLVADDRLRHERPHRVGEQQERHVRERRGHFPGDGADVVEHGRPAVRVGEVTGNPGYRVGAVPAGVVSPHADPGAVQGAREASVAPRVFHHAMHDVHGCPRLLDLVPAVDGWQHAVSTSSAGGRIQTLADYCLVSWESACRWTIRHSPASRRKIIVTRYSRVESLVSPGTRYRRCSA